jgi:hypothetical protein
MVYQEDLKRKELILMLILLMKDIGELLEDL